MDEFRPYENGDEVVLLGGYPRVFEHLRAITFTISVRGGDTVLTCLCAPGDAVVCRSLAKLVHSDTHDLGGASHCLPVPGAAGWYVRVVTEQRTAEVYREPTPAVSAAHERRTAAYPVQRKPVQPDGTFADRAASSREAKYPFAELNVGDQFIIPQGDDRPKLGTVRVLCSRKTRAMPGRFLCRELNDGSITVWREA